MRILAVDTATDVCSVALVEGTELRAEVVLKGSASHSRHLLDAIEAALTLARWKMAEVNAFAVTRGPGSFTGLRIGISTLKGLASGLAAPLIGVSTLEALAWQCQGSERVIIPMLDGRRGEIFTNHYRFFKGRLVALGAERALVPEAALAEIDMPCLLVGNGVTLYHDFIQTHVAHLAQIGSPVQNRIHGLSVAALALMQLDAGVTTGDPAQLTPQYIRKPDAKLPARPQASRISS